MDFVQELNIETIEERGIKSWTLKLICFNRFAIKIDKAGPASIFYNFLVLSPERMRMLLPTSSWFVAGATVTLISPGLRACELPWEQGYTKQCVAEATLL